MNIVIESLNKSFGEKKVLQNLCAEFAEGKVTALMGPSGCGKTTLLRILLGLEQADSGRITGVPENRSAVFQENRLFEAFSAVDNLRAVMGKTVSPEHIEKELRALGLAGSLHSPVRSLSGGMKRRVALARAVLFPGWGLLVLDEPFKGLDEDTRASVAAWLRERIAGRTVIAVTHDPDEPLLLGGENVRILQMDRPSA